MEVSLGLGDIAAGGSNEEAAALVEAKKSATDFGRGVQQALRYLSQASGYYTKGFLSAPYIDDISNQATGLGIITHDREGKIKFRDAPAAPDSAEQSEVISDANGLLNLARIRSKMTFDGRLVMNI